MARDRLESPQVAGGDRTGAQRGSDSGHVCVIDRPAGPWVDSCEIGISETVLHHDRTTCMPGMISISHPTRKSAMRPSFVPSLQQSRLAGGRAATWRFDRTTVVSVQQGRVWITLDGEGVDWFLDAGMALRVPPRQRLVLEAAGPPGEAAVLVLYAEAVPLSGAMTSLRRWSAAQIEAWSQRQKSLQGGIAVLRR
ncbi:DUF2917 domain-containing protein [Xylophilus sp. Kf1]|nr:DUF2917 domain-containing protein [Xylophilus sp. Kf1]